MPPLGVLVGPIDAGDGLQQDVVAHRLVEVQAVEHRRVEAGEQFFGDDKNPGQFVRIAKVQAQLALGVFAQMEASQILAVVVAGAVDDLRILRRQVAVERVLVQRARLAVHAHQEGLVAHRLDDVQVVPGDVGGHPLHACGVLEHIAQRDRLLQNTVELLHVVTDALGLLEVEKLAVEHFAFDAQLAGGQRVAQRDGGAVGDGLGDAVLVQVTLGIVTAKNLERAAPARAPVNRRAGEADQRGVGQRGHQVGAQRAAGGAVRLVHQDEDVGAGVDPGRHTVELVDGADDDAAPVAAAGYGGQQVLQAPLRLDLDVAHTQRLEDAEELAFQLVAVHQQQHGGVLEEGMFDQLLGDGDHGVGLAGALCVPDQAAALLGVGDAANDALDGAHLVGVQVGP